MLIGEELVWPPPSEKSDQGCYLKTCMMFDAVVYGTSKEKKPRPKYLASWGSVASASLVT